ncbi:unnamed protein product [Cuscuta campestris]|uniref:Ubiquitin-like protease family profile domain-containing protein n=1 Tax=Cuscuta campestris TaxID=132261 RepID=A0A484LAA6_9ASTE|nr:unnamed protein product [Cuscuta campestris]
MFWSEQCDSVSEENVIDWLQINELLVYCKQRYLALKRSSKRSKKTVVMASPIRRSGRLQIAEIKKMPKVHTVHVDLSDDDEDSVDNGAANGNDNAGSDVSGDDAVSGGDEGGNAEEETDSDDAFDYPPRNTSTDPSFLVDSPSHGYVNNWVLKSLEDVDGIAQLNWCEYVHRALIDNRVKWEKGNRKYYTGPLLCLMVFYVDRVVLYSRDVERMSPAFLGCTSKILRDRENNEVKAGGFGLGYDDGRFVGEVMDVSSGDKDVGAGVEQVNVEKGNGDAPEPRGETRDDSVEVFVQKFAEKGRVLATTIIDLVSLIESAPPGTIENDVFKQLQLATGRLLGLARRRGGGSLETPDGGFSEVTYDEGFWSDPANIDQLIANEQAVLARSKYKKIMEDMPSFSLGFSQLDGENENVNIDGGDIGVCRNTPSTPAVRVVNGPESNPGVENDCITPVEVQCHKLKGIWLVETGISQTGLGAGVSEVGDVTVRGTVPECPKAVVKPFNAARKLARTLKPAGPLRSPYLTRPIDLSNGDEAIFVKDGLELTRSEIASLDIGKHISKRVIDVWSIILNHNEKFRSDKSPLHVFARSMDCVANGDIVDVSGANVKNMFANALLHAWDDMADDFNWGKAELYFFPIMQRNWAYVLCVDLKSRRCDILDSSSAKAKNEDRYGDMPKRVVRLLGDFLEQQKFFYKGKCVKEMVAKRNTFPWRDPKATFDYGVATMRHMETYMGDGGKGWNCGLSKLNLKPMKLLRFKYCACILLNPVNSLLDKVYEESEKLERERKGKDPK